MKLQLKKESNSLQPPMGTVRQHPQESGGSSNTVGDSSTDSIYDFSDELNESVHVHEFFSKEVIDDDIEGMIPDNEEGLRFSRASEASTVVNPEENRSSIFGMFSKIFTGNKANNKVRITSMATNGKTILLGYSNSKLGVYDLFFK